jgi:amino-acid N-acetyltransferase
MGNTIRKNTKIVYFVAELSDKSDIINLLKTLGGDKSNFNIDDFYIAKDGSLLVGCIRVKPISETCVELSSLAVIESYQHQGIGSDLVKKLLTKEARRPIFLLTEKNKERFYKKFGFCLIKPENLPTEFLKEYERIIKLPFAKSLKVIAMVIK